MNDQTIEQEIQAKGKTAPRVTPADIEANIAQEVYFTAADAVRFAYLTSDPDDSAERERKNSVIDGLATRSYSGACIDIDANTEVPLATKLLTFCVLVLQNGFTVTGESACASPENFDAEIGRKIARQNAVQKIWPLMGYELRSKLMKEPAEPLSQPTSTEPLLPPHQQRVVQEKQELDDKLSKLDSFIASSPIFLTLAAAEQERLTRQFRSMESYSGVLAERIAAF